MRDPVFQKVDQTKISFLENTSLFNMQCQHYHDTYEIYLQLEGERFLSFDNETYRLKRGSLFIITPFVMHMTRSAENPCFKRYLLGFSPLSVSSVLNSAELDKILKDIPTCVITLNESEIEKARFLFEQAYSYSMGTSPNSNKMMQMAVALLIDFIHNCTKKLSSVTLLENNDSNSAIYTAVSYINSNYDKDITLDFICSYVHMSKSNFCLVFKKIIGDTFIDYLNAVRISQAHKLLTTTTMRLGEIAEKTGFSSPDYMSRIFKKIHGVSPSVFKKCGIN